MNKEDNKFTWGDAVLVKKSAPKNYHPGEFASICGMNRIITQKGADKLLCKKGEWIYIIEYEDGSSMEVPESFLYSSRMNLKKIHLSKFP
jgi:hypothetical protein